MSDVKQPEDRKPKKSKRWSFEGPDGTVHHLPLASEGAEKLTGRQTRDALMNGDAGQLKLGFILLESSGAEQKAIDALYDQPTEKTITLLGEWMEFGDGTGASVPQS